MKNETVAVLSKVMEHVRLARLEEIGDELRNVRRVAGSLGEAKAMIQDVIEDLEDEVHAARQPQAPSS